MNSLVLLCIFIVNVSGEFDIFKRDATLDGRTCLLGELAFSDAKTTTKEKCLGWCSLDPDCHSVFYVQAMSMCYGCTMMYSGPGLLPFLTGSVALWKKSMYGESCSNSLQCVGGPYLTCINNTCACQPGYPYNPSTGNCATGCSTYGSTYNLYLFFISSAFTTETQTFQPFPFDCMTYCTSKTWCVGFDHSAPAMTCWFKSQEGPGFLGVNLITGHYMRNCA